FPTDMTPALVRDRPVSAAAVFAPPEVQPRTPFDPKLYTPIVPEPRSYPLVDEPLSRALDAHKKPVVLPCVPLPNAIALEPVVEIPTLDPILINPVEGSETVVASSVPLLSPAVPLPTATLAAAERERPASVAPSVIGPRVVIPALPPTEITSLVF